MSIAMVGIFFRFFVHLLSSRCVRNLSVKLASSSFFWVGEKGSLKLHPPWRSWLLRILSVYNRRLLFSAGVKWSLKLHPPLRLSLQVPSPNS